MTTVTPTTKPDKYILRFEKPGHRDSLKTQAALGKRTLNKHILLLIEAGEKVANSTPAAHPAE